MSHKKQKAPTRIALRTHARQARTIRRLFTAYFLAKAKWQRLQRHFDAAAPEHNLVALLDLYFDRQESAAQEERARIVAALRNKITSNKSAYWDREATALGIVADAIERGEL